MIQLRWYQKIATKKVIDYFIKNPNKHPIIATPTGSGKSLMIADLIHQCVVKWNIKILVLSHRKEILVQNKSALDGYLSQLGVDIETSIYSAGLGKREVGQVTVAGIQSCYNKSELFKDVKLIIIDEAHMIAPSINSKSMYNQLINKLNAKCVGYTGSPYRLGTGYIVGKDHIFDEIIFDLTSKENFNRLVKEGFLTKLISKRTQIELDATKSKVPLIGGDFSEKELSKQFDKKNITKQAVKEIVKNGADYKKWLIFAIDIEHAEHIVYELEEHDIITMPVHSKLYISRDPIIKAFKEGKIRCLVNVNILTTGIDIPDIDLIAFLRPTKSPVVYVQSGGRGLRIAPGKNHCLVLDFARIVSTLGPINNVLVHKSKKGKTGDAIMKTCPDCNSILATAVKICPDCGFKFEFKQNITKTSSDKSIVSTNEKLWYDIDDVSYFLHNNKKTPKSMKVTYLCGLKTFSEWICVEQKGWAKNMANNWIKNRNRNGYKFTDEIDNADELCKIANDIFVKPKQIRIKEIGKYPEILDFRF